jgi:hypothetical protein
MIEDDDNAWLETDMPAPLLNPKMRPEKIEILGVSFQSIQISWNHLTSAKVDYFRWDEVTQLFQHASQMTYCHILEPLTTENFSMAPIIHRSLKTLRLTYALEDEGEMFLGSLTLPCLQEFHTNELFSLTPTYLPALVHRSSCPLTNITLFEFPMVRPEVLDDLKPLRGVTDLVWETLDGHFEFVKLLLEGYVPDVRHLTLRVESFLLLWSTGVFTKVPDGGGPLPDAPNEGRLLQLLVVDPLRGPDFVETWNSDVGKELKKLNVRLRADGFEFLCLVRDQRIGMDSQQS